MKNARLWRQKLIFLPFICHFILCRKIRFKSQMQQLPENCLQNPGSLKKPYLFYFRKPYDKNRMTKKAFYLFLLLAPFCPADAPPADDSRALGFEISGGIAVSNVLYEKDMFGGYVLNLRHYQAANAQKQPYVLNERQILETLQHALVEIDGKPLDRIQMNWDGLSVKNAVVLSLKAYVDADADRAYFVKNRSLQKNINSAFADSPFVRKLCAQLDGFGRACDLQAYRLEPFLEPLMFKTGAYSSVNAIRSDPDANLDWKGSASYPLWFAIPVKRQQPAE